MENVTAEKVKQLQSEGNKVLVDYWAPWCGPCRTLIPRLESIESDYPNVTFVKVNVDENQESCMELGIRSVPTIIIYDGNTLVNRSTGVNGESYYKDFLNKL
jgi:thioredoxin